MAALETLPTELLLNILSYAGAFDPTLAPLHPLYTIAATNKYLHSVAEEYARGLLKKHTNIDPPNLPKKFVYRRKWIRWLVETCQMCKKRSKRRAILDKTLTCCMPCDKQHFPKMTMTAAITKYGLSKLDLFTPNPLHPSLPPLTIGRYVCMGGDTIMIATPSVIARRAHILSLLGSKGSDTAYLRRRVAAHDRLITHMRMYCAPHHLGENGGWVVMKGMLEITEKAPKSMQTEESRRQYVRTHLEKERKEMGMCGFSAETAIELE